jgi:hypothetical protein
VPGGSTRIQLPLARGVASDTLDASEYDFSSFTVLVVQTKSEVSYALDKIPKLKILLVLVLDLLGLCVETRPESSRTISFR